MKIRLIQILILHPETKVFNGLPENILGYNLQGTETRQQSIIRSRKASHYSSKRGGFFQKIKSRGTDHKGTFYSS